MTHHVGVLIGSLRRASFTRKVTEAMIVLAPDTLSFDHIAIGDLPLFNQDYEEDIPAPASYAPFRAAVAACDALLFATPEYNRSVPAVLKNALDVGSRPYGSSVWGGKPAAVISVSPGALGGALANHALRQSLVYLDTATMAQPEAYIGNAAKLIGDDGQVVEASREMFTKYMAAFAAWIERVGAAPHG